MPSLHPSPDFDYYYKACRKGDREAKAVTINQSAVRALADASEITGLPRDNFEVREITGQEYERFRPSVIFVDAVVMLLATGYCSLFGPVDPKIY